MKRSSSAVVSRSYILIWVLPFLLHCNYNCGCFNIRLVTQNYSLSFAMHDTYLILFVFWNASFSSCTLISSFLLKLLKSFSFVSDVGLSELQKNTPVKHQVLTWPDNQPGKMRFVSRLTGWFAVTVNEIFVLYNWCGTTVYCVCLVQGLFLLGLPSTALWTWLGTGWLIDDGRISDKLHRVCHESLRQTGSVLVSIISSWTENDKNSGGWKSWKWICLQTSLMQPHLYHM